MSTRWFCIAIILVQVFDANAQNTTNDNCGIPTTENQYPWLVGIEFQGSEVGLTILQCTGALINRRHVVSSAQCFQIFGMAKSVQFGPNLLLNGRTCTEENKNSDWNDDGAYRVPIETVISHPEFNGGTASSKKSFHDIALVKLRDVVTYTSSIRPICLPNADVSHLAATDRELHVQGIHYGVPKSFIEANLDSPMTYLTKDEYLKSTKSQSFPLAQDQISAKRVKNLKLLACLVTGALLVNKRDDKYELSGILDHSFSCSPGQFTNVYTYLDWIKNITPDWTPCGRRRVETVELIVTGEDTKAGDWPWHAAILRTLKSITSYICGGTLISKTMVLTAAHCATINGEPVHPTILTVVLGKYHLIGTSSETQEREVSEVISHEQFDPSKHLENDIALLKLKTEAIYSDYVQPACIWYKEDYSRLPDNNISGTVVGWGIDQSDALSSALKQAKLPKVLDSTCIQRNPLFYSNALNNNKKFCAGWANGTSPCNGDSGGGFLVFVPDRAKDSSADALGSWYIRGVVSLTASLKNHARCDPYQYVVFTDVEKYTDWIKNKLSN